VPRRRTLVGSFGRGQDLDLHHHFAGGGELDPVAEQIHEHLAQAGDIPDHGRRDAVVHLVARSKSFSTPSVPGVEGVLDAGAQIERLMFQLQLAGLDLGEVQYVVNDRQEDSLLE